MYAVFSVNLSLYLYCENSGVLLYTGKRVVHKNFIRKVN